MMRRLAMLWVQPALSSADMGWLLYKENRALALINKALAAIFNILTSTVTNKSRRCHFRKEGKKVIKPFVARAQRLQIQNTPAVLWESRPRDEGGSIPARLGQDSQGIGWGWQGRQPSYPYGRQRIIRKICL